MKSSYIECGKIINTHGCHGGIKVESWCNTPEELCSKQRVFLFQNGQYTEHKIKKASVFKQFVLLELADISDMDVALLLKNKVLYAAREDFSLEDGEYFLTDLIGLPVMDADTGRIYGTVTDIVNRGASDLYVVKTENGERYLPNVSEFVRSVEIPKGIFVTPIEGLLE